MAADRQEGAAARETVAEAVIQLRRTAEFLRSMPMSRLSRGDPTVADRGRLIASSAASLAADLAPEVGPPAGAELPAVGDPAVGDLIGMVANELEYATATATPVHPHDSQPAVTELILDCIRLRRTC